MSTLAFFPWFALDHEILVADRRLVPFERGDRPGGDVQPILDAVLAPYLEGENRPVHRAALLVPQGTDLTTDLDDESIAEHFALAELVAFAGLSGRTYFGIGSKYSNRDTFQLVIQHFTDPGGSVSVVSRRRDGSSQTLITRSQYKIRRPLSQAGVRESQLDEGILRTLVSLRKETDFAGLAEAIYFFNQANTDSDGISEQGETVSMVSAFERLLDCRTGKEDTLAERFTSAWRATTPVVPDTRDRIPPERRGRSITESWIRDFFQHRGFHAHGRRDAKHAALWTPREHLLLGAYAFPLLLKQVLSARSQYVLSDNDRLDIDVFEQLTCARHFEPPADPDEMPTYPWNEIRGNAIWKRAWDKSGIGEEIQALLDKEDTEAEGNSSSDLED